MKKAMIALAMGAMTLSVASTASAASFSPGSTADIPFGGSLTMKASVQIDCDVVLGVTTFGNPAGNTAAVTSGSVSPGDFRCAFVWPTFNPNWPITVTAVDGSNVATGLDISNVTAVPLGGTCGAGTLSVLWDDPNNIINIAWQSIPGSPNPCFFGGSLANLDFATTPVHITNP